MPFLITKDIIDDGVMNDTFFYKGSQKSPTEGQKATLTIPFRLLDDDDEVYFEGLCSNSSSFAPLDYFGSAYGCTDIQYFENEKWESL